MKPTHAQIVMRYIETKSHFQQVVFKLFVIDFFLAGLIAWVGILSE